MRRALGPGTHPPWPPEWRPLGYQGGADSVPEVALNRLTSYRRSHGERQHSDAQLFAQHARCGSDTVTASTAPLRIRPRPPGATILTRNHFHELSRAAGPK